MDATTATGSIDAREAAHFGALAADWWDPAGSSAMLHRINPVRLRYIRDAAVGRFGAGAGTRRPLAGRTALDVGCGAGLVTEPLARMGAAVTGLDAAPENIAVARAHAAAQGLAIDYRAMPVEALAATDKCFDLVTCLEVIEHVADRAGFLRALAALLAPGGVLVFSTPNRTPASWAALIVGAERLTRAIPRGTHDWRQFLTPAELAGDLAAAGLSVTDTTGLTWRPGTGFVLGRDMSVNYIGAAVPA